MKGIRLAVLLLCNLQLVLSLSSSTKKATTIAVCTGPDCLVDGATGSLKSLQANVSKMKESNADLPIKVKSRPCLGPCGDGPCCTVLDEQGKRVVRKQPSKGPGSLAPADLFGVNPAGIYQVRTQEHVDFVAGLAMETAGVAVDGNKGAADSSSKEVVPNDTLVTTSSRPWYDRPRNERKALQRLAQFLVLVGLYDFSGSHGGEIGNEQWIAAGVLFAASLGITVGKS